MINYLGKYRKHVKYIPSYRNKACVAILEMNFPWNNKDLFLFIRKSGLTVFKAYQDCNEVQKKKQN